MRRTWSWTGHTGERKKIHLIEQNLRQRGWMSQRRKRTAQTRSKLR
jgi:hypothetical protein